METISTDMRELAQRQSDGIEVTLFWNQNDGNLAVFVCDERTGDRFGIDVGQEKALDVFNHPFAYADRREPEFFVPWKVEDHELAA
jgi:hypothetical protein